MFLLWPCSCLYPIYWSQVLSWEWRCSWNSAARWCSNYIWVINNFIAYQGTSYISGLTVSLQTGQCSEKYSQSVPWSLPKCGIVMVSLWAIRLIISLAVLKPVCSWSSVCQCCSNYIVILHLTPGFSIMHKDNCKARWETYKFWDLILEIWRYLSFDIIDYE